MRSSLAALLRSGKSASVIACLAAACALVVVSGSILFAGVGAQERAFQLVNADIVVGGSDRVVVQGADDTETVELPEQARLSADSVGAIEGWAADRRAEVIVDHVTLAAASQDPDTAVQVHSWSAVQLGNHRLGPQSERPRSGHIVLNPVLADQADVGIGDTLTLRTAAGVRDFQVSGVLSGERYGRPAAYVEGLPYG